VILFTIGNTAYYLAAESYRYGATRDPAAKALAWRTFEAMEKLCTISGELYCTWS